MVPYRPSPTAPDGPSHPIVLRPRPVVRWVRCVPSPRSVRGPRHYEDMSLNLCTTLRITCPDLIRARSATTRRATASTTATARGEHRVVTTPDDEILLLATREIERSLCTWMSLGGFSVSRAVTELPWRILRGPIGCEARMEGTQGRPPKMNCARTTSLSGRDAMSEFEASPPGSP